MIATYVEELVDSVILKVLVDALNVVEVFRADTDLIHLTHDLVHGLLISGSCTLSAHA